MKKLLFLFSQTKIILLVAIFFSFNMTKALAQATCATATNIASLPYNTTGFTNCGLAESYSGTPACLAATSFSGPDYVFTYTPTATGCVNAFVTFAVASSPWNSGFAILDRCPTTAGAICVASTVGALGATSLILTNVNLTAGTTYYFVVSGGQGVIGPPFGTNECFGFDFKLSDCPIPPPPLPTDPQGIECGNNLGFEDGNLNGWTGYTDVNTQTPATVGLVPGVASVNGTLGTCGATAGWVGARQTVTTGGGFDANTDNVVPVVAPGCRTSSVRLGNHECGYQAEAMEKTFLVTPANVLFTYLYAVVLQNPAGHSTANQPKFEITIKNNGGNVITCGGTYAVTADNALAEGFTKATNPSCGAPDVWYKNWTAVGTDLTPYLGQNVTIRFTTIDCAQGGHFGYAYVDTYCKPKEITGTQICTTGGSVTLSAPQGFSNYVWSPGGTTGQTITINNPQDGDVYTVNFNSIVGSSCSTTITDTIRVIDATATGDTTICNGAIGSKQIIATSTDPSATYSWTSSPAGFTSSSATPLVPFPSATTVYNVTVTSPLGCTLTNSVTITVVPCGMLVNTTSEIVCEGSCATVTATPSSGTPPYTLLWNTGETTSSITACPTTTTSYTVTASDNASNTASAIATITVNPNPVINVADAIICSGGSATLTASGADMYSWSPTTGLSPTTGSPVTANPTATTTYTITGTVTATGCTGSTTVIVTVNPNPTISVSGASICAGGSTPLTATGADTYTWTPSATLSSGTGTTVTATPTVETTYTITGTTTVGCTGSTTAVVAVGALVTDAGPDKSICSGGSTTLTATGGTTFSWSPATGLSNTSIFNPTANPTVTTTYTVTATSGLCTDTDEVIVVVDPPILLNIAGFPPKCAGGTDGQAVVIPSGGDGVYSYQWAPVAGTSASINVPSGTYSVTVTDLFGCTAGTSTTISEPTPVIGTTSVITANCNKSDGSATVATVSGGTPGYTYSWNTSPVQSTQTANNISTGTYIVTITDANGCTATIAAFVPNAGGVTASTTKTDVICFGGNNGSAIATQTGGTGPYTYLWNNGQNTNNATALIAGTYTVTVTDANGCSASTTAIIAQPTQVVVTSTSASMCPLTSATINAAGSGGIGTINFIWNPGALSGPSAIVSPINTTVYTLTGTDANGCTGTTTATVTVNPVPVIVVPNASICLGTSTPLTASGANTYTWSPATGLTPATGANVTANPTATTTYTVIGVDANGCTGVTTVVVTVNPVPVISAPPSSICPGDTTTLTATGADTYTWSPATGLSPTTGATVIASPTTTTSYVITGTNSFGCTGITTTTVTVHPEPKASFAANPNPASVLNPTVYFTDLTGGAITWSWNLGDLNNTGTTVQNPSFTYPDSIAKYTIQLIVTNQFGCIDTTYGTVVVKGEFTFFIPNTFTPNGDGTNDYFFPKGVGIDETDYDLWIFDRWGNLIWHTSIWGEQWDGRANGGENVAQIDTYVWKVHVREKDNHVVHNYIGHVNIVK